MRILSWKGMDTTSIMMAPLPYRGRKGPLIKPRLVSFLVLTDT